jgi:hypothetical protein
MTLSPGRFERRVCRSVRWHCLIAATVGSFHLSSQRLCGGREALVALENRRNYGASATIAGLGGRAPAG